VAECERVPLAPVTVTVNEPATDPAQERVDVPEVVVALNVMLVGDSEHIMPVVGEIASANVTAPVKPFVAATVMVEVPDEPTAALTVVGLALTVKFGTAEIV
jgi:hypothetical protein